MGVHGTLVGVHGTLVGVHGTLVGVHGTLVAERYFNLGGRGVMCDVVFTA